MAQGASRPPCEFTCKTSTQGVGLSKNPSQQTLGSLVGLSEGWLGRAPSAVLTDPAVPGIWHPTWAPAIGAESPPQVSFLSFPEAATSQGARFLPTRRKDSAPTWVFPCPVQGSGAAFSRSLKLAAASALEGVVRDPLRDPRSHFIALRWREPLPRAHSGLGRWDPGQGLDAPQCF